MLQFLDFFGKQKVNLKSSIRKSYHWRLRQLDHLERMLKENKIAFCDAIREDHKVPSSVKRYEIGGPIAIIEFTRSQLREWVAPSAIKTNIAYQPYELSITEIADSTLILLLNPLIAAISAGNPVFLKADIETPATNAILVDLLPQYFDPGDVAIRKV